MTITLQLHFAPHAFSLRDVMRRELAEEYEQEVAPYRRLASRVAEETGCALLEAPARVIEIRRRDGLAVTPEQIAMLVAGAVEELEARREDMAGGAW